MTTGDGELAALNEDTELPLEQLTAAQQTKIYLDRLILNCETATAHIDYILEQVERYRSINPDCGLSNTDQEMNVAGI